LFQVFCSGKEAPMSRRYELTDEEWDRIEDLLPGREGDAGGHGEDNRLFVNAVIWIARTGAPWRDLPERFGLWNSVFQRFNRWAKAGVWEEVFRALQSPDLAAIMLDSTVIRAHQHAAGSAQKKNRARKPLAARVAVLAPSCISR
jgi:transposase